MYSCALAFQRKMNEKSDAEFDCEILILNLQTIDFYFEVLLWNAITRMFFCISFIQRSMWLFVWAYDTPRLERFLYFIMQHLNCSLNVKDTKFHRSFVLWLM